MPNAPQSTHPAPRPIALPPPPAAAPPQDTRPTPPTEDYLAVRDYPFRIDVPQELQQTMRRTVGYALDFIIDTLDYSPEEPSVPANEAELCVQPNARDVVAR